MRFLQCQVDGRIVNRAIKANLINIRQNTPKYGSIIKKITWKNLGSFVKINS